MIQKSKLFVFIALSCITISGFLLQSCEEDEFDLNSFSMNEFIDIQKDINDIEVLMNAENRAKYQVAVDRVLSLAHQNGTKIEFNTQSGIDVNISEQLYNRITQNTIKLIESGNFILFEENGKNVLIPEKFIGSDIVRLKSTSVEGSASNGIFLGNGCNEAQAVLNGFKSYDSSTCGSMNDIWNMDSRNWGTASQNVINTSFTLSGYSCNAYLVNGCYNSNNNYNGSNSCSGNYICEGYKEWDPQTQMGTFILNDCQSLPLAFIKVYGYEAYQYMISYLNW
ncbi:MAG: hypothetical protein JXR68_00065 [Bacteroidales bacterium]|nr:hypothetical protein [Bacteroidales bacterium]